MNQHTRSAARQCQRPFARLHRRSSFFEVFEDRVLLSGAPTIRPLAQSNAGPNTQFIAQAYNDILGRAPDSADVDYWTAQFSSGASHAQLARSLNESAGYLSTVINAAYQTFLARPADEVGLEFWLSAVQKFNWTDEVFEANILASPEFYADAGGTTTQWLDAAYQDVLGRSPDLQGEAYWIRLIGAGADLFVVAYGLAASAEHERTIVQEDYVQYLGRAADQAGTNYWVSQYLSGMTNESIISQIVGSPEFSLRASAGDVPVTPVSGGTWTALSNLAPSGIKNLVLLSNGTVMAQQTGVSNTWYQLTPDSSGNYMDATWTQLAPMQLQRYGYTTAVLPDGRVLVIGGEYSGPAGDKNDANAGEIYDPTTNSWNPTAPFPEPELGDEPSEVLPDGNVLVGYGGSPETFLYNPATNAWSTGAVKLNDDSSEEETWVKLPDGSILSYDLQGTAVAEAQRYVPSLNKWVDAGHVPVSLQTTNNEIGPALLLPDGKVFFIGATGHTALYTPPASPTDTGGWTATADIPDGLGANDAPAAMLPNGNVLLWASFTPNVLHGPTKLFDYAPSTNSYTDVTPSFSTFEANGELSFDVNQETGSMLVLPSGQVLLAHGTQQLNLFTPTGTPVSTWQPTITNIQQAGPNTYTLTGTLLNGLSEGSNYGDDEEMATNFPIIRLTSVAGGTALYARSFNWSSTGVATGSAQEAVQFALPPDIAPGIYNVAVIANGIASASNALTVA